MKNMYNPDYASQSYPGLLAEVDGAQAMGIAIAAGEGTLPVGSVVVRDDDGYYAAAGAADVTAAKYLAVLDQEAKAPTGEGDTVRAYIKGTLLRGKLLLKGGAAITPAMLPTLRAQGIILKDYINAEGVPSGTLE